MLNTGFRSQVRIPPGAPDRCPAASTKTPARNRGFCFLVLKPGVRQPGADRTQYDVICATRKPLARGRGPPPAGPAYQRLSPPSAGNPDNILAPPLVPDLTARLPPIARCNHRLEPRQALPVTRPVHLQLTASSCHGSSSFAVAVCSGNGYGSCVALSG